MSVSMFDVNSVCDSIIKKLRHTRYRMSLDEMRSFIRRFIENYDHIFDSKSIEDKNRLMKQCCCDISRLSTTMLFSHNIDLTLNDCAIIGASSINVNEIADTVDSIGNNNDDNESIDNTCAKCDKHIVVVVVGDRRIELENDETVDEWQIEDKEPVKSRIKKPKRRYARTGFPRSKNKVSGKKLANTKQSSNPIKNKCSDRINQNENRNQNANLIHEDDDNDDNEESYVKFMGSTFRARDLMKKCDSCDPNCELDELTLAFYVMIGCKTDDDLPRDLRKHCRISESSDSDNNDQQITQTINQNENQISINGDLIDDDLTDDDLNIIDVNEIFAAEKDWFGEDVLDDGLNEFLSQTSKTTSQSLPFDQTPQTNNFDQSFVVQPSTSGYGNTGYAPIINNVHTLNQKIIINSHFVPPVSSIPSSDCSQSELPPDLVDLMLDFDADIACNSGINCDFDAIAATINNQSTVTSGKSVTASDKQTLDEALDTTIGSLDSINDSINNAVITTKKKTMKRSHDN